MAGTLRGILADDPLNGLVIQAALLKLPVSVYRAEDGPGGDTVVGERREVTSVYPENVIHKRLRQPTLASG